MGHPTSSSSEDETEEAESTDTMSAASEDETEDDDQGNQDSVGWLDLIWTTGQVSADTQERIREIRGALMSSVTTIAGCLGTTFGIAGTGAVIAGTVTASVPLLVTGAAVGACGASCGLCTCVPAVYQMCNACRAWNGMTSQGHPAGPQAMAMSRNASSSTSGGQRLAQSLSDEHETKRSEEND